MAILTNGWLDCHLLYIGEHQLEWMITLGGRKRGFFSFCQFYFCYAFHCAFLAVLLKLANYCMLILESRISVGCIQILCYCFFRCTRMSDALLLHSFNLFLIFFSVVTCVLGLSLAPFSSLLFAPRISQQV